MTLVSEKTNLAKTIEQTIREYYGSKLKIFNTKIPMQSNVRKSTLLAKAYESFTKDVLSLGEKQRIKNEAYLSR